MAVDFSRLPAEVPVPDQGPSPLVWTLVFLVLGLAGGMLALLTWPRNTPTQTPWFWFCVTVMPICLSGALTLRPFSHFRKQQLRAQTHNRLTKVHNDVLFERASVPLAVLASGYRVHAKPDQNTFEAIVKRSASLPTRPTLDGLDSAVASYLEPDAALLTFDDEARQRAVLDWVLQDVAPHVVVALQGLPERVPITVWLDVSGSALNTDAIRAVWKALPESVCPARLRAAEPVIEPTEGLMLADSMLDRVNAEQRDVVTVLISVTLNRLHAEGPEPDSAEAACFFVLCPSELAQRLKAPVTGWLNRPQSDTPPPPDGPLPWAIRWGCTNVEAVAGAFLQGVEDADVAAMRMALRAEEGEEGEESGGTQDWMLDTLLGNTGQTAPWLAAALALDRAVAGAAPYVVGARSAQQMLFAVVSPAERATPEEVGSDA